MVHTLFNYLRLMRITNCSIAFLSIFVTSFIASGSFAFGFPVFTGAMVASFIMGGGNALNDYFDYQIDKLNKPDRPIPSGRISRRRALVFAALLFFIGLGLSFFLNVPAASIAAANTCLLIIYARYSKRMAFAANVTIALMTSSVFIFSGIIVNIINLNIIVLASSAFFVMAAREVLKDIEDIQGDRQSGALTLPIKLGIKKARAISTVLIIPAVLSIFLPYIFHSMGTVYLILVVGVALTLTYSLFLEPEKSQKVIKWATVLVLLAFVVGSL